MRMPGLVAVAIVATLLGGGAEACCCSTCQCHVAESSCAAGQYHASCSKLGDCCPGCKAGAAAFLSALPMTLVTAPPGAWAALGTGRESTAGSGAAGERELGPTALRGFLRVGGEAAGGGARGGGG